MSATLSPPVPPTAATMPPMMGGMLGGGPVAGVSPGAALGLTGPQPMMPPVGTRPHAPAGMPRPGGAHRDKLERWAGMRNIATDAQLDVDLEALAALVKHQYDIDDRSRADWKSKYRQWLDCAMQITQAKSYPWPEASNVIYPLLTVAAVYFHARAYPAIIRDQNVVKGTVVGDDSGQPVLGPMGEVVVGSQGPRWDRPPGDKQRTANLVGRHMSWQLLTQQEEWEPQTDWLLVALPIVGTVFRKSYFDPNLGRNVSEVVDALRLCVNYHARSFETAPRHTELISLYPWEITEKVRSGLFLDEDYGHDTSSQDADQDDEDAPCTFLEQHRRYDLDRDGYAEPYIVTIARDSGKLARIAAGYNPDEIEWTSSNRVRRIPKVDYYTKYSFIPSPDSKVYDLGFGHLLYPINESINTSLNQMFDAGHLQNAGGGFIGSALSLNTGPVRFSVGEYKPVNTMGGVLRDQVLPLPFQGPSTALFQLLQFLVEAAERIASVKDVMVGDMPGDNTSGITTLAVIEQGLKVFSAIYKRIHRSLGYEFRKLYRLNRLHLSQEAGWQDGDVWRSVTRADYEKGAGVQPISDPQMVTDMQRLGRAQYLLTFKDDPRVDGMKIIRDALEAAMIPAPDSYMVQNPQPPAPVALKSRELDIREKREMTDLALRQQHDRALMLREIAQAEYFLAQARAKDNDQALGWVQANLERLKLDVDAAGQAASATGGDQDTGPAAAAGGANAAGVQPVAPSPGIGAPAGTLPAGSPAT